MDSTRGIAASYAYYSTYSNTRESRLVLFTTFDSSTRLIISQILRLSKFPYDVAFRELAAIKAEATGTSSTINKDQCTSFPLCYDIRRRCRSHY